MGKEEDAQSKDRLAKLNEELAKLRKENDELVKIKIIQNPSNKIYKFKIKIYFSSFMVSKNILKKFKNKNAAWIKKNVKFFKHNFETEKYLLVKKKLLMNQFKQFE